MAAPRNTRKEDKAIAYLRKLYEGLDEKLQKEVRDAAASDGANLVNDLQARQARISAHVAQTSTVAKAIIIAMIAAGYEAGLDYILKQIRTVIPARQVNAIISQADKQTLQVLAETALGTFSSADQIVAARTSEIVRSIAINTAQEGYLDGAAGQTIADRIQRALISSGATELEGKIRFVSIGGRNYSLGSYAELVARTATRQSATKAMSNRLLENGLDLVEVDDNEEACDECAPLTEKTYSLTGQTAGYETVPEIPVHPNCRCVLTPAPLV